MAHYLVIVESPAKVKTIKKFLGSNYTVAASQGHVRDLPKSQLGIDVENDYEPKYITIRGKGEILATLRKEAKKSDKVYLATDPDREGEAISWHLAAALKLDEKKMRRITFNEITKNAVKASLKAPRDIDMDLVDAQQARRELDRMVGYKISPLLWAKVKRGLSAGRVQSVALRIVADREAEIDAFIPEEYWSLDAQLKVKGEKRPLTAKFYGTEKKKMTIHSKEEMDEILKKLENEEFQIVLWDFGAKENIIRELTRRGCRVADLPACTTAEEILKMNPDGIMLSNGPGNPEDNPEIIEEIRKITKAGKPMFGICLGHQLLAIAKGAKTGKMKFGHRGANQPVKDLTTGRVYISSQNHGYEVLRDTLPEGAEETFINVNDGTCEGITYHDMPAFTVQFHPEACAGPKDTEELFGRFIQMMRDYKEKEGASCR